MSKIKSEVNSIIVKAGAGAGKTRNLTYHVLNLAQEFYKKNNFYPGIVVTTFTRKATIELKERLVKLSREQYSDLDEYVEDSPKLNISTIHGILDNFLRKYGSEIGLDANFDLMSSGEGHKLAKKIFREIIYKNNTYVELLEHLSFEQLFLNVRQFEFLFYSELDKKDSVTPCTASDYNNYAIQIFKKYLSILRNNFLASEINSDWTEWVNQLEKMLNVLCKEGISKNIETWVNFLNKPKPRLPSKADEDFKEYANELDKMWKNLKSYLLSFGFLKNTWFELQKFNIEFDKIAREYCAQLFLAKLELNKLDMSDLELFSLKLLNKSPQSAKNFSKDFQFWIVDEYQDTSPLQVKILNIFFQYAKSYYVVGDPQQSIYLFRGSRERVFLQRLDQVKNDGGRIEILDTNYRSSPKLLQGINRLVECLGPNFQAMNTNPNGMDDIKLCPINYLSEKVENPSQAVISYINRLKCSGNDLSQVCILVKSNKEVKEWSNLLELKGIENIAHTKSGFSERPEVLDLVAFLKFLIIPEDNLNLVRLIRSPWFKIDDVVLVNALDQIGNNKQSHWNYLRNELKNEPGIVSLEEYLSLEKELGIYCLVEKFILESGLLKFHRNISKTGRAEANIFKFLDLLSQDTRKVGFDVISFIKKFDEFGELSEEMDAKSLSNNKKVEIMTIHASKGLEFEFVILLGMNKRPQLKAFLDFCYDEVNKTYGFRIPFSESMKSFFTPHEIFVLNIQKEQELAEFYRLFYVALTRAKKQVLLVNQGKIEKKSWSFSIAESILAENDDLISVFNSLEDFDLSLEKQFELIEPKDEIINKSNEEYLSNSFVSSSNSAEDQSIQTFSVSKFLEITKNSNTNSNSNMNNIEKSLDNSLEAKIENKLKLPDWDKAYIDNLIKGFGKINQGVLLHRVFEMLKSSNRHLISEYVSRHHPEQVDNIASALEYVASLKEPNILELIKGGFVEWPFSYMKDGLSLKGQIDLWGKDASNNIWIVDYKSGSQKYIEKAFRQLEIYREALSFVKNIEASKIGLCVIYPLDSFYEVRFSSANKSVQIKQ